MIRVVDVETTGVDAAKDRVVEVAAVPVRLGPGSNENAPCFNAEIGEGASSLVYPAIPIPPTASAVHHLIDEDVESAPPLGRAINQILGPFWQADQQRIFVAHSARFDRSFLPPLQEGSQWICTYRCALHVWPEAPRHSNQTLRYWLKLPVSRDLPVHRALGDAVVTAHLFARLLQERSLDDLLKLSTKAVLLKRLTFGKHKDRLWTEVPTDYIEWFISQKPDDPDERYTAKYELARRRGVLPTQQAQQQETANG